MFWYWKQKLCTKWDSVLSDNLSVGNGLNQCGILSPKLFIIYANTLNTSLNKKYIVCFINANVVNHLYYADDLVLFPPTASRMHELILFFKMESSCRYLGHIVTDENEDTKRSFYG